MISLIFILFIVLGSEGMLLMKICFAFRFSTNAAQMKPDHILPLFTLLSAQAMEIESS